MIGKSTFDRKLPIPKKILIEEVEKMIIKKLTIGNFRGIKNTEFDFDKKINVLSGKNGIGKTTIIDSIMWVFCDETIVYGKQSADNRSTNNLREPVYVKIEALNDNANYVFERKYYDSFKEDYNGELVFQKVVNEFKINGAKYGSKEYFDFIKNNILKLDCGFVCPKDYNILRSVMDYNYFGSIDYKIARSFLEKILELESDDKVVSSEKYSSVKVDLQTQKFDVAKTISKFKAQVEDAKQNIALKENLLQEYQNEYSEEKLKKLNDLISERDLLFKEDLAKNPEILALNQVLLETQEFISKQKESENKANFEVKEKINQLVAKGNNLNATLSRLNLEKENIEEKIKEANEKLEKFEDKKVEIEKKEFQIVKCSNCGNIVNKNEVDKFEEVKRQKLDEIDLLIKEEKEKVDELNEKLSSCEKAVDENLLVKKETAEEYYNLKNKLANLEEEKESEEILEAKATIEKITDKLETLKNQLVSERQNKFNAINGEINALSIQETLPKKIGELNVEIKNLKTCKAISEQKIDLVKEFKENKLNRIKEKISDVFPTLDIEILEENVNTGTIKEVCYLKLKNTEYKGINDGHRKMIGITFIENIKKKLGLENLPLVFDKFADIDDEMLQIISNLTNSQIFTTKVGNENEITLL